MSVDHAIDCSSTWPVVEDPLTNKEAKGYAVKCRGECRDIDQSRQKGEK